MNIVVRNRLEEIPVVARRLEAFGSANDLPPDLIAQLQLAVEETITNIIHHDEASHEIEVALQWTGGGLEITIIDDGRPFSPLEAPPPELDVALLDRAVGGLGIHLIRTFMDRVDYVRDGDRNRVTLVKRL